jgi:cytoskeletal protein RodZ
VNSLEKDPFRNLPLVKPPQTGKRRAAWWQITAAAIAAVAIIFVFLWGISNQRDETAGQPTAATQATPASPQGEAQQAPAQENTQQSSQQQQGSSNAPATTGQGNREQGEAEQKTNSGQPSNQQPTNANQNAPPTENSGSRPSRGSANHAMHVANYFRLSSIGTR